MPGCTTLECTHIQKMCKAFVRAKLALRMSEDAGPKLNETVYWAIILFARPRANCYKLVSE